MPTTKVPCECGLHNYCHKGSPVYLLRNLQASWTFRADTANVGGLCRGKCREYAGFTLSSGREAGDRDHSNRELGRKVGMPGLVGVGTAVTRSTPACLLHPICLTSAVPQRSGAEGRGPAYWVPLGTPGGKCTLILVI